MALVRFVPLAAATHLLLLVCAGADLLGQENPASAEPPKAPSPVEAVKERLKKHEADLLKIRQAMLKEVDDELKKIDDAMSQAEKARDNAKNDREAFSKALVTLGKLRGERQRVQMVRFEVERLIHLNAPPTPRPLTPEQRLGVVPGIIPAVLAAQLNLEKGKGVVVERVEPRSPADTAGLKVSDILLQVDGKAVPGDPAGFRKALGELRPDAAFDAVILRQGKQETFKGLKLLPEAPK